MSQHNAERTNLRTAAIVLGGVTAALLLVAGPAAALAVSLGAPSHPPKTPKNLSCHAESDGVHVAWDAVDDATSYNVWRKVGNNGQWIVIGSSVTNSYVDHTAASGQLYHYAASSVGAGGESGMSGTCNVVSIPFFPSAAALGLATVGGLGVTSLLFRRRK
ncbi:MAG: hypothetical protein QOI63_1704 [Thermoplasmata archaeon]|jgi:hypothetical protein|nr:hypothetical protein [Thermoplasmata archaeon]